MASISEAEQTLPPGGTYDPMCHGTLLCKACCHGDLLCSIQNWISIDLPPCSVRNWAFRQNDISQKVLGIFFWKLICADFVRLILRCTYSLGRFLQVNSFYFKMEGAPGLETSKLSLHWFLLNLLSLMNELLRVTATFSALRGRFHLWGFVEPSQWTHHLGWHMSLLSHSDLVVTFSAIVVTFSDNWVLHVIILCLPLEYT